MNCHDLQRLAGVPVGVHVEAMCPAGSHDACDAYLPRLALVYGAATLAAKPARSGQVTLNEVVAGP